MSSFYMRPVWADEYPEFYQALKQNDGYLEYIDEFDVPFWSNVNYVSLTSKASHPIFKSQRKVTLNVDAEEEMSVLHKMLETWDKINACEQENCQDPIWRPLLLKLEQPRRFPRKKLQVTKKPRKSF